MSPDALVQEFVEKLVAEFVRRVEPDMTMGGRWARDQFFQSLAVAAISTASDVFQAVSGALHERKVFDGPEK